MSHVRQQIRAAVVAALTPIATTVASRIWPLDQSALPVLLVYSGSEEIEGAEFGAMDRRYDVNVEAVVAGENYDDTIDGLLVQIEQALNGDLGGLVLSMTATGIEVSASAEGSTALARARITFEAQYRTSYADPETSI
jgi:hypothetical protein